MDGIASTKRNVRVAAAVLGSLIVVFAVITYLSYTGAFTSTDTVTVTSPGPGWSWTETPR